MVTQALNCTIIKLLNNYFTKQNDYLEAFSKSTDAVMQYNIKSGEVVYNQFEGFNCFNNKIILDYGCGFGGKSIYYATRSPKKVIGVDIVDNFKLGQNYAEEHQLPLCFSTLQNGKLPIKKNSVDIVISSAVFEHIENVEQALHEIYRILKPGGLFLLRWHPFRTRYGAHLDDAISIPFAHLLFREQDVLKCYSELLSKKYRNSAKMRENMKDEFYIDLFKEFSSYKEFKANNFLSVKDFSQILQNTAFRIKSRKFYLGKKPIHLAAMVPDKIKDYFIDYEIYVLEK